MTEIIVKKGNIEKHKCEAMVVTHFEGGTELEGAARLMDEGCGGLIAGLIKKGDFEGKLFQFSLVYPESHVPAKRIAVLGLGKRDEFDSEKLKGAFSKVAQKIRDLNIRKFSSSLDFGKIDLSPDVAAESVVEGVLLGLYSFNNFKTLKKNGKKEIDKFTIVEKDPEFLKTVEDSARIASIVCGAVYYARDLVSMPSNEMTPTILADSAKEIASGKNIKLDILEESAMKDLGMNALLGVSRGSREPAKLIVFEYSGGKKGEKPIALIGKGITFDSGGISIKPSEGMDEMKTDMAGGAAVMGVIKAVAELEIPLNIVGLIPATENLPGGNAYKPGDILRSMSGQTIEIKSTDAEGRLILADILTYANGKYKPAAVVDLATLTGACIIALGDYIAGMMGTDEELVDEISRASEITGEQVWRLPLWHEYDELIESDVADFKNTGGRAGGAITAGIFLSKFAEGCPWAHIDIAGPAFLKKDKPYIPKGASGIGVRLVVQFLRNRVKKDGATHS